MKRRTAVRKIILLSAGAGLLNSCERKPVGSYESIPLSGQQEDLLAELTETIIPKTDFPGAKDLNSRGFVLIMVDDCATPEDQQRFMAGIALFDENCKKQLGSVFVDCTPEQRATYLKTLETEEGIPEDVSKFYRTVKRYTIQSFTTSEQFLTQVRNYSLIPPPFQPCVPVQTA
jgi:hypothetical protein